MDRHVSTLLPSEVDKLERMFVLGIDPGLSRCGYGLVGRRRGDGSLFAKSAGVIETDPTDALPWRLGLLHRELKELIDELKPEAVCVERVFFQVNARTAMSVGQASGLALSCAATAGCDVFEYTSNEVKQAVVGYGGATKKQVQEMVARVLELTDVPSPPDVADALALGICHMTSVRLRAAISRARGGRL